MSKVATLGVDDAATHAVMLLDHRRVERYAQAIAAVVRPGDVVADIGAGSGLLAALAARAGARRVFAIERGPVAHLARKIVQENGLDSVVEVLRGDARAVTLPEPPTVLLSETLGNFGIDEGTLALFALLARRSDPRVRIIPRRVEPMLALLEDTSFAAELDALHDLQGLDLRALRASLAHRVMPCRLGADVLASVPTPVGAFHPGLDLAPGTLKVSIKTSRRASINGLGGWFRAELTDGIALDTGPLTPPTHWGHLLFPVEPPLRCEANEEVEIELTPRLLQSLSLWSWRVRCGDQERRGDALGALFGGARDIAAQLGGATPPPEVQARLETLRVAFEGPLEPAAMARRLVGAYPERYASAADAEQEVWALLRASAAML